VDKHFPDLDLVGRVNRMRGNAWNIELKIVQSNPEDKFSKVTVRYYLLIGIPRTKDLITH